MNNETIAQWASGNMYWLEQRQAEMNSIELDDELLIALRAQLNAQGVVLHTLLEKVRYLANL